MRPSAGKPLCNGSPREAVDAAAIMPLASEAGSVPQAFDRTRAGAVEPGHRRAVLVQESFMPPVKGVLKLLVQIKAAMGQGGVAVGLMGKPSGHPLGDPPHWHRVYGVGSQGAEPGRFRHGPVFVPAACVMTTAPTIPTFVVVGQPNEGKTTVMATLTENDAAQISPIPGTTTHRQRYAVLVNGQEVLVFWDTPGFENSAGALDWFKKNEDVAANMAQKFLAAFERSGEFVEECEILKPIAEGAAVIYVVDSRARCGRWTASKWRSCARAATHGLESSIPKAPTPSSLRNGSGCWPRISIIATSLTRIGPHSSTASSCSRPSVPSFPSGKSPWTKPSRPCATIGTGEWLPSPVC